MIIHLPGAVGELIDKITILRIKAERLTSPKQLKNVRAELALLEELMTQHKISGVALEQRMANLHAINLSLWETEDLIRAREHEKKFDERFIELARSIYKLNDRRAAEKREINALFGSIIQEEKSYFSPT